VDTLPFRRQRFIPVILDSGSRRSTPVSSQNGARLRNDAAHSWTSTWMRRRRNRRWLWRWSAAKASRRSCVQSSRD